MSRIGTCENSIEHETTVSRDWQSGSWYQLRCIALCKPQCLHFLRDLESILHQVQVSVFFNRYLTDWGETIVEVTQWSGVVGLWLEDRGRWTNRGRYQLIVHVHANLSETIITTKKIPAKNFEHC